MKGNGRLFLILRLAGTDSDRILSAIERCLDLLAEAPAGALPVHWNFPVFPLFTGSEPSATRALRRILDRPGDMLVPMGYSGAPHHLLSAEELACDIAWAAKNPFSTGLETKLGARLELLVPAAADLIRASSRARYAAGPPILAADPAGDRAILLSAGRVFACPTLPLGFPKAPPVRSFLALLRRFRRRLGGESGLVIADPLALAGDPIEALVLAAIKTGSRGGVFASLRDHPALGPAQALVDAARRGATGGGLDLDSLIGVAGVPLDPSSRRARLPSRRPARKRRSAQATRERLELLAAAERAGSEEPDGGDSGNPVLLFDMQGEVVLDEGDLQASFSGGRLAGLRRAGRGLLVGRPSRAFIARSGRERAFSVVSAFSFEGPGTRGLRTTFRAPGEAGGRIVTDLFFADGFPRLVAGVTVRYPDLDDGGWVDSYAPIEMPLFALAASERVEIAGWYPDGEAYSLGLPAEERSLVLPGCRFLLSKGDTSVLIAFPADEAGPLELLPLRLRECEDGLVLFASPHGSYAPTQAARLAGMEEHFTFFIDATRERPLEPPDLGAPPPGTVPAWIRRREPARAGLDSPALGGRTPSGAVHHAEAKKGLA